jgi:hypothetical protein
MHIETISEEWDSEQGTYLAVDTRELSFDAVDLEPAAERAADILDMQREDGTYIIPLFKQNAPIVTKEYVIYKRQSGQIGWIDAGFGNTERFADTQRLDDSIIAQRLKYWLSGDDFSTSTDRITTPADSHPPITDSTDEDIDQFFEDLHNFVQSERQEEKNANWDSFHRSNIQNAQYESSLRGPFLISGRAPGNGGFTAFRYQMDADRNVNLRNMGLFPENRCIAAKPDDNGILPIEVELTKVQTEALTLQPIVDDLSPEEEKSLKQTLQGNSPLWLHPLLNPVPFDRRLNAISSVRQVDEKRSLITGTRPVRFSSNKFDSPTSPLKLNKYQREAVYWADATDDLVCIHGPPGTGKTRTLTAYIDYAVSEGNRVLVTAHSNQAVDNLLAGDSTEAAIESETLHAMAQGETDACTDNLRISRAGSNSTHRAVQTHYADKSTTSADVVAATMSGASQFDTEEFDVVVVDEATQASRPATAIALNAGRKLVLAGDHKQLPPYCSDESMKSEEMHISLFEYLLNQYGEDIAVPLNRQYRMNESIAAWPNEHIYDGHLETAAENKHWQISELEPLVGIDVAGGEARSGTSWKNTAEATVVADEVDRLLAADVAPGDIGVISGYTGQLGPLKHEVDNLDRDNTDQITIDTVDSFQGGEREAIIVSFVRSNEANNSGFLTFPEEGPRRLNVAVTRARKRLVLVGDWTTLGTYADKKDAGKSCADLYRTLANTLQENGVMQDVSEHVETT